MTAAGLAEIVHRRDLAFQLYEVLDLEALTRSGPFAAHDRETFEAVLDTAERIALERFAPLAARMDAEEPFIGEDGRVVLPEGVRDALDDYFTAGFHLAHLPEERGGMGLPLTISQAAAALFTGANPSLTAYPFLTIAAANLLDAFATDDQKRRYLAPMREGRFFGTMCLSEPQAGSSLADIRTRARPVGDDERLHRITGSKMWISGGEHELAENIVHLVLARLPDAPAGVKGISLFIVPKYRLAIDGAAGEPNDVRLVGLNHKMGYRGTTNCLLAFGDEDDCLGELVGEPNRGLAAMFHMMNEARIGVGLGAAVLGYAGYRHALAYAQERLQGRPIAERDPASPPVPIIRHADVRRMLVQQKVHVEGALLLCLDAARIVDEMAAARDEKSRRRHRLLLELLIPIVKAWPSHYGLRANELAIQVLGGYGYTRDFPLERLYRDNRLNPIHEGTNGIQSLDLLARKVPMAEGRAFRILMEEMAATVRRAGTDETLREAAGSLEAAANLLSRTTIRLMKLLHEGRVEAATANSWRYLQIMGHIVVAWGWLRQGLAARAGLQRLEAEGNGTSAGEERAFYEGKLAAMRFFFAHELPLVGPWAAFVAECEDAHLSIPDEGF